MRKMCDGETVMSVEQLLAIEDDDFGKRMTVLVDKHDVSRMGPMGDLAWTHLTRDNCPWLSVDSQPELGLVGAFGHLQQRCEQMISSRSEAPAYYEDTHCERSDAIAKALQSIGEWRKAYAEVCVSNSTQWVLQILLEIMRLTNYELDIRKAECIVASDATRVPAAKAKARNDLLYTFTLKEAEELLCTMSNCKILPGKMAYHLQAICSG